jgi:hypothetical protein
VDFDLADCLAIHQLASLQGHLVDDGRLQDPDLAQLFIVRVIVAAAGCPASRPSGGLA